MLFYDQNRTTQFLSDYSAKLGQPAESWEKDKTFKLLETLTKLRHFDEYYCLINLKEGSIPWCFGFANLGYSDEEIKKHPDGILHLTTLIHPVARGIHSLLRNSVLDLLSHNNGKNNNRLLSRFVINIPVRKKNGSYVFVKQMSIPLQKDENGLLYSYINVYCIIESYQGNALRPRFFEGEHRDKAIRARFLENAAELAECPADNFNRNQFKYMDRYLSLSKTVAKPKTVLKKEYKSADTIYGYESQIPGLAKKMFKYIAWYKNCSENKNSQNFITCMPDFSNFKTTVFFLYKSGILNVLRRMYEIKKESKIKSTMF